MWDCKNVLVQVTRVSPLPPSHHQDTAHSSVFCNKEQECISSINFHSNTAQIELGCMSLLLVERAVNWKVQILHALKPLIEFKMMLNLNILSVKTVNKRHVKSLSLQKLKLNWMKGYFWDFLRIISWLESDRPPPYCELRGGCWVLHFVRDETPEVLAWFSFMDRGCWLGSGLLHPCLAPCFRVRCTRWCVQPCTCH